MEQSNLTELFNEAKKTFENGETNLAESILNQLVLKNFKNPEVFHLLGTIYYDQGKFTKAIRSFKRALSLDPSFTDASVGLSIILNDLGRYDEGKKVFEEAQSVLKQKKTTTDPYINEKLSIKHDELGEMYFRYQRYKEALEQYYKSLNLSTRRPEITLKIIECYEKMEDFTQAIRALKSLLKDYPQFIPAQIKLGKLYYESNQIPEALHQWEGVLQREPNNKAAQEYLRRAHSLETVSIDTFL